MFSSPSSTAKLRVGGGGGVARALAGASSPAPGSRSGGPSLLTVAAALAAAVAAVGGSVYLCKALRSKRDDDDDDDDDMFSSPTAPRQHSPAANSANLVGGKKWGAAEPPARTPSQLVGGRSGAHPYSKAKAASMDRLHSQTAVDTKGKGGSEVFTEDIAERNRAMNLVRALLNRAEGFEFAESSNDSDTDSDETDVSFNYHTATELEALARDELMDAFAEYEMEMDEKMKTHTPEQLEAEDEAKQLRDMAPVLVKMAEYLDMSNEREKLRVRRDLLRTAASATAVTGKFKKATTHTQFVTEAEEQEVEEDAARHGTHLGKKKSGAGATKTSTGDADSSTQTEMLQRLMAITGATGVRAAEGSAAEMDRALARAMAADAAEDTETFEDDWEDDDDAEEEAAFMEYLQQRDDANRFYTRQEVQDRRRSRNDPSAMRVVGADGRDFADVMDEWLSGKGTSDADAGMRARHAAQYDDEEFGGDFGDFPQDPAAQEAMYRRLMGLEGDEEGDEDYYDEAVPWTDEEKTEFEANLLDRVREMAEVWGVTVAEGERAVAKEEEDRRKRKEERRNVTKVKKSPSSGPGKAARSTITYPSQPRPAVSAATADGDGEVEDEWEDVEDADDAADDYDDYDDYDDHDDLPVNEREVTPAPAAAPARFRRDTAYHHVRHL